MTPAVDANAFTTKDTKSVKGIHRGNVTP